MKPAALILIPFIIGAGFLISPQIRKPADDSKPGSSPATSSNRPPASTRSKLADFDWSAIAAGLSNRSSGSHEELHHLSINQLKEALRQIKSSSLDIQQRWDSKKHLLILLIKAAPSSFLLDPDLKKLAGGVRHNWKGHALAEWTRQSPTEATSWLDSLSDQSFPEDQLITLKRHHFSSLIIADFESAKARLQETPAKQRHKMIENYDGFGKHWTEDDFKDHNLVGRFAELARSFSTAGSNRFITFVLNVRGE